MAMFYDLTDGLDAEILRLQEKMEQLDPASDAYKAMADQLKKLFDIRLAQHKSDDEMDASREKSKAELEIREKELAFNEKKHEDELREAKIDRRHGWARTAVEGVFTVVKAGVAILTTAMMLDQGYKFEEHGACTSSTFREGRKVIGDTIKGIFKKK